MFVSRICTIENIRDVLNNMLVYIRTKTNNEDSIFNCRLIACELITNVLVHSKCGANLQVNCYNNKVEIIVESDIVFCGENKNNIPDCNSYSGRGLYLVHTLCDSFLRDGKKAIAILNIAD